MAQICSICKHGKRGEIDAALLDVQPLRSIAARWSVSKTALIRHRENHLPARIAKAPAAAAELEAAKEVFSRFSSGAATVPAAAAELEAAKEEREQIEAGTLFNRLKSLNRETQEILREARKSGDNYIALQAIARAEKQLELEARLLGELDDSTKIAIGVQVRSETRIDLTPPDLSRLSEAELKALHALVWKTRPEQMSERVN